jgi:hypothetical protein
VGAASYAAQCLFDDLSYGATLAQIALDEIGNYRARRQFVCGAGLQAEAILGQPAH